MVISRVLIRVTPFRALITLLITYLLSPRPLLKKVIIRISPLRGLTAPIITYLLSP